MTEGIHSIAVNGGDGAIGADTHIAREELDTDHRTGLELARIAQAVRGHATAGNTLARIPAQFAKLRREVFERGPGESGKRNGRGDFLEPRLPRHEGPATRCRRGRGDVEGRPRLNS